MKKSSRPLLILASAALLLSASACGKKDDSSAPAASVNLGQNVPPPAGKQWRDVVAATPETGFVMGNPNAPVKLIEFGSYTCPHCRDFTQEASEPLRKMVDTGKLSYEFRSFLRDPYDLAMALLARCGGAEPFFPMMEQLFGNQEAFFDRAKTLDEKAQQAMMNEPMDRRFVTLGQATGLVDFVKQRGISEDKARQCLADTKAGEALVDNAQKAAKDFNISGTPTFILNGKVVEDTASWSKLNEALKGAGL